MPSDTPSRNVALAIVGMFMVAVLLWGYFVAQQLLLSVYIAVLGALVGGFLYVAVQYLGGSGGTDGTDLQT
ncbi:MULTISPECIES: hypothetical protein [Haloarcula]|uniref:hypothetical protein n=1 Tax=Haloarcula TaxID=2237 RepID=UPI0023EAC6EB|nr:hypothetical protein [Halomicroarcula sp. XH51]